MMRTSKNLSHWRRAAMAIALTFCATFAHAQQVPPVAKPAKVGTTSSAPPSLPENTPTPNPNYKPDVPPGTPAGGNASGTGAVGQGTTSGESETTNPSESEPGITRPDGPIDAGRTLRTRIKPERPFYFTARYAQRYDDNVLFSETERTGDLVFVPELGAGLSRVTPRSLLQADYLGGGEIYHRFSNLNGAFHSLALIGEYDLTRRTTILAANRYITRPNPLRFGLLAVGNGGAISALSRGRSSFDELTLTLRHQYSRYSSLRANFIREQSSFADPRLIDNRVQTVEFGYTRQLDRQRHFDLAYRNTRFADAGRSSTHTLIPSLSYQRGRMLLRGGLGPQLLVTDLSRTLSWTGRAEVLYSTSPFTTYNLSYNARIGAGGGLAAATRNQTVQATVTHLRRRLETEFNVGYSRSAARGSLAQAVGAAAGGFTNTELLLQSRLTYPMEHGMGLFLDYTHARQIGSGSGLLNASRNQFSLGVTFDTRRTDGSPRRRLPRQ